MKSETQIIVISKLKKLREQQGYSQAQIADTLGISYGQMGNIESLKQSHKYTLEHVYALSRFLNVPIESIFLNEEELRDSNNVINKLICKIIEYEQ